MDIEQRVSDMYSNQMRIQQMSKLTPKPQKTNDQSKNSGKQSAFGATEVLAERLLILEKRVQELERKVGL